MINDDELKLMYALDIFRVFTLDGFKLLQNDYISLLNKLYKSANVDFVFSSFDIDALYAETIRTFSKYFHILNDNDLLNNYSLYISDNQQENCDFLFNDIDTLTVEALKRGKLYTNS